jgi:RND family efflux transporter MFP subunit
MNVRDLLPSRLPLSVALGGAAAGLVLVLLVTMAIFSPSSGAPVATKAETTVGLAVTTTQARESMVPVRIPASGTIGAIDEVILGSEVAGLAVAELNVDEGDQVTKGQVLARLNRSILDAQLAQTSAQIVAAQGSAAEAAANERRAVELGQKGFVSKQSIDQRRSAAITARAQVSVYQAQRDEIEARLKQTVITAPSDGVIAVRGVSQGQVVGTGTELFRIIRDGKLEWNAELPDYQLTQLIVGQPAKLTIGGQSTVEGTIRLISEKIDEKSRNGVVHVALPADARLRSGMFARGEIISGDMRVLTVPQAAVVTKDGESYVFKVGGDGRAQQTKVETGVRTASLVEVRRGLERGVPVVLDGAGLLSDGDQVRVTGRVANETQAAELR